MLSQPGLSPGRLRDPSAAWTALRIGTHVVVRQFIGRVPSVQLGPSSSQIRSFLSVQRLTIPRWCVFPVRIASSARLLA